MSNDKKTTMDHLIVTVIGNYFSGYNFTTYFWTKKINDLSVVVDRLDG